jgi:Ca-activated chloride channel family protein
MMPGLFSQFRFAHPWLLLCLGLLPLLWIHQRRRERNIPSGLSFPPLALAARIDSSRTVRALTFLFLLRLAALALMILALARPQKGSVEEDVLTEGVDIMVALDCSGSMAAEDFQPDNRIAVAKQKVQDFILGRRNDRIGLVVFSARSFTKCPLTLDYDVLLKQVEDVRLGMIQDGTAIGNGLATAVNRLRASKAKSRVIILLTDGVNNTGEIDPLTASELAQSLGIKVYTIGVGKEGLAPVPVDDPVMGRRYVEMEVKIDEEILGKIAAAAGGQYYRATDSSSLARIFKTIDGLEKSKISAKFYTHYRELLSFFLWPAVGFFLLEVILANTRYSIVP